MKASEAMTTWDIGLAAWIIQDGNYPDFERGQVAEFAVEFQSDNVTLTQPARKSVRLLGDARYQVVAEVVYVSEELWVVDFGIQAFVAREHPSWIKRGVSVTADVNLDVDYYIYFEQLYKLENVPALIYSWAIDDITTQRATRVPAGSTSVRDEANLGYRELEKTNAWEDNLGHAEYILHCTMLDEPPRHTSRTANYL